MNWYERRTIALELADKTEGLNRVPSPERHSARWCEQPEPPYTKLDLRTGKTHVMSRQERRHQDRKEAEEPVLSGALQHALSKCLDNHPALIIRSRSFQKYTPAMVGDDGSFIRI